MIIVNISTYGSVSEEAGWNCKEVMLEQARATVEGALISAKLRNGRNLLDLVADEHGVKEDYTVLLNGRPLWKPKDLKREVQSKNLITAMGILYPIGGG